MDWLGRRRFVFLGWIQSWVVQLFLIHILSSSDLLKPSMEGQRGSTSTVCTVNRLLAYLNWMKLTLSPSYRLLSHLSPLLTWLAWLTSSTQEWSSLSIRFIQGAVALWKAKHQKFQESELMPVMVFFLRFIFLFLLGAVTWSSKRNLLYWSVRMVWHRVGKYEEKTSQHRLAICHKCVPIGISVSLKMKRVCDYELLVSRYPRLLFFLLLLLRLSAQLLTNIVSTQLNKKSCISA